MKRLLVVLIVTGLSSSVFAGPMQPVTPFGSIPETTSVTVAWQAAPGITHYAFRLADESTPNGPLLVREDHYAGTSIVVSVTPGHTYGAWVHTVDPITGAFSAEVDGTRFTVETGTPPPPEPASNITQGATILPYDDNRLLEWTWTQTDPKGPADGFRVKCGTAAGAAKPLVATEPGTSRSTRIIPLLGANAQGTYFCHATAFNSAGESSPSPETSFTIAVVPVIIIPPAPGTLTVK